MTLPYTDLRTRSTVDGTPELTGGMVAVGEFSLTPAAAAPGASLELFFDFNQVIPGLTSVEVMMGSTSLGDEVPVEDPTFTVRRLVPDFSPGKYEVTVLSRDVVLATAEFTVLERSVSDSGTAPVVVLGVLALVAGLGWRATRIFHSSRASSGSLGLADKWYAWREGRRR